MESWRKAWREGLAPLLNTEDLEVLREALRQDDSRLIQGATTVPPPLQCVLDWPVEAADAIAYCGWQSRGLTTVGEVEEFFARMCFEIDRRLSEPAACRYWLNWWDDCPREELFQQILSEVELALASRSPEKPCS